MVTDVERFRLLAVNQNMTAGCLKDEAYGRIREGRIAR